MDLALDSVTQGFAFVYEATWELPLVLSYTSLLDQQHFRALFVQNAAADAGVVVGIGRETALAAGIGPQDHLHISFGRRVMEDEAELCSYVH